MKKNKPMDDQTVRVIKVGQDALLELIYETFIDKLEAYFDTDSGCPYSCAIDWENREFIFCVLPGGDDDHPIPLPPEIDLETVMNHISDTTDTLFRPDRYREYTQEELIELSKKKD